MTKLLILDRDGTIITEPPSDYQIDSYEKLGFLPKAIQNLAQIEQATDYQWLMITNQDGLGTDSFPEDTFWGPHNLMMQLLESEGIPFKDVLIDRSFPEEQAPTRKPATGLLKPYLERDDIDWANSIVIGDRLTDMQLAVNLGCKGIMLGKSEDASDDSRIDQAAVKEAVVLEAEHWDEIRAYLLAQSV